ncbi:hypothetical protein Hanom_Chr12g01150261 [Helianthus anomalus]
MSIALRVMRKYIRKKTENFTSFAKIVRMSRQYSSTISFNYLCIQTIIQLKNLTLSNPLCVYKYSVNAIINDSTKPIEVVFFNEGMEAHLKITCKDLRIKHGCTDPKKLPQQMALMIGKSKIMHLSLRKENNVVVTNVSESETTVQVDSPAQHVTSSSLPPATPNLKANKLKRPHA